MGDTLKVTVINHMNVEEFTMHWHGIHQINTNFYDGLCVYVCLFVCLCVCVCVCVCVYLCVCVCVCVCSY